jgi:hypothetical protein
MKDSAREKTDYRPFNWPKAVAISSLLGIPVSYAVYAGLSGENHFGQGLEHSLFRPAFAAVQVLAFLGLTLSPCLRVQSECRQGVLMVLAFLGFLFTEALSFAFIAFNGFPD